MFWLIGCESVDLTDSPVAPSASTDVELGCGDGACQIPSDAHTRLAYHRVAVDEAGVAWVSWIEVVDSQVAALWVARSAAPGAPFEPAAAVPYPEPPIISTSEKPDLAVSNGRIVVGYSGRGNLRHADAHVTYVQTGTIGADGQPAFDPAIDVDFTEGTQWVLEQPHVALVADEAWYLYKRQVFGEVDDPSFARESNAFVGTQVSDALPQRHECSPPDLIAAVADAPATTTGSTPVAFAAIRGNLEGRLETMVVAADDAGFGTPVQVSSGQWAWSDLICPNDGPVLAQQPDGTLIAYWVAQDQAYAYRSYISASIDGGATWTLETPDHPDEGYDETNPTVTALPDGKVITTVQIRGETHAYVRQGVAGTPEGRILTTPLGAAITDVEVATGGGRTVGAGFDGDGRLWLIEIVP